MNKVFVAGVVSVRIARQVDSFPVPYHASLRVPGGISVRLASSGWTAARTLQRLGTGAVFATYVGADLLGQLAVHGLREHHLYGPTTLVCDAQPRTIVLYDDAGRRASARDLRLAPDLRYPVDVFTRAVDDCGYSIALLTNTGFTQSLIPAAVDRGVPIATDFHLVTEIETSPQRERMAPCHILACSHEQLSMSPENLVTQLWKRFGTSVVLIGCGPGGTTIGIRDLSKIWRVEPTSPRGVRYTSGAGDTLLAAFVHHYLGCADPLVAARYATLLAGWKIGGHPDEEPGATAETLAHLEAEHGLPATHRIR